MNSIRSLAIIAAAALVVVLPPACASAPARCPYVPPSRGGACPVCVTHESIVDDGEVSPVPSFSRRPVPDASDWSGDTLPEALPPTRLYVRCRPCDCSARGVIEPYDAWRAINQRSYARLRSARAPYPIAIVPGFHAPGIIMNFRVRKALDLLASGWVAAIMFSGGHRRAGLNEAAIGFDTALALAARLGIDVRDRLFVEPCACHTSTNVRNSFRMLAAMLIPRALLITDSRITGQAQVFTGDFDHLVDQDLRCFVGRLSHLRGPAVVGLPGTVNGCRPALSLRQNPVTILVPRREAVVYWASPFGRLPDGVVHSSLECSVGGARIAECEPEQSDDAACLPIAGHTDLRCTPRTTEPPIDESDEP